MLKGGQDDDQHRSRTSLLGAQAQTMRRNAKPVERSCSRLGGVESWMWAELQSDFMSLCWKTGGEVSLKYVQNVLAENG